MRGCKRSAEHSAWHVGGRPVNYSREEDASGRLHIHHLCVLESPSGPLLSIFCMQALG